MAKKGDQLSKVAMVRDALEKLGWEVAIEELAKYILDTYGVEMSKPHISQTKSNLRKKMGKRAGRRGRKKGSKNAPATASETGAVKIGDILDFVTTIKQWEEKIGAANIRDVVKKVL